MLLQCTATNEPPLQGVYISVLDSCTPFGYPETIPMSAKLPVVVIVGRPNVGKSTLFNRLVGKRVAVVEDTPGVTRDRLYAECTWNGKKFMVVDTGGILFSEEDPLIEQIRVQAEVALAE